MPSPMPKMESLVEELKDAARTSAFQRGVEKPGWPDLWSAMASIEGTRKVLQERGVNTSGFASDLQFILNIGDRNKTTALTLLTGQSSSNLMTEVREELIRDLDEMAADMADSVPQEQQPELSHLLQKLQRKIITGGLRETSDQDESKEQLKFTVLANAVKRLLGGDAIEIGNKKLAIQSLSVQIADIISQELTGNMLKQENPLDLLDRMMPANPMADPSPIDIIEQMLKLSDPVFDDLLFRNGYLTNDAAREDKLAANMPIDHVRGLALQSLSLAYAAKSPTVDTRHIVQGLLEDRNVQVILSKLGMKDLMSFQEKFEKLAFKQEDKNESGVRVRPKVSFQHDRLIWQLNDIAREIDEEFRGPEMLFHIFKTIPEMDKMLNEAGLRRRMSRSWHSAYDEDWKLKDKPKDKKKDDESRKKKKEFEISDEQLNSLIAEYCVDYTALAKQKKFDPMIGQADVMDKIMTILLKRGKKNPITIGDAGVGKSKLLEGLAQKIVAGKVPAKLIGSRLLSLDLHGMDDSPYKGIFESRILPILKGIAERNASGRFPLIQLAIDEFGHAMDAGAHSQGDGIKGMIKPYLTTGDLVVIANTTTDEYQKKLKKDGALSRRFNPVTVEAPTVEETAEILKQLKSRYAKHHHLRIPDSLLPEIAEMAGRYIQTNQPDKSIDMLDYACAIAARENAKILERQHVIAAASDMSGIDREFLNGDDEERYRTLPEILKKEVLQQDRAVMAVVEPLQRAKVGLKDPNRPLGNFLFMGPTGVGKTELSKALARFLFGSDEKNLLRYDMSEYMEKHAAARLIGAPPGYVGFDEGGKLINDINNHPFAVILWDEFEKAHPDVYNALLGPFDNGFITDGRGRKADMRQTINIMTSNLGAQEVLAKGKELGLDPVRDFAAWQVMARPIYKAAVARHFKPEFVNRLDDIIFFDSLKQETIDTLVDRRLDDTRTRLRKANGLELRLSDEFRIAIVNRGFDVMNGARPLKRAVQSMLEGPLASFLLGQEKKLRAKFTQVVANLPANDNGTDTVQAGPAPQFILTR